MKWHDVACSIFQRELWKRARGRTALLMILPRGGAFAEIGVWKGRFSGLLCEAASPRQLLLIDPWSDSAEKLPWHGRTADIPDAARIFEEAYREVAGRFAGNPAVRIIRAPSLDAAPRVGDGSLDAVYIDGAHGYEDVRADLRAWAPKLRPGGLLTGDDYYWSGDGGQTFPVRRAVDEFIREMRPRRWAVFRGQFVISM
jgi:SAM-dependent methyltransferase